MTKIIHPPLSDRQKVFIQEYLIDLNATQAALRAGYSPKSADRTGHQLMRRPRIEMAIHEAMKAREKRTEITQDMVLQEWAKLGFSDMGEFVTIQDDGTPVLDFTKAKDLKAVQEIIQETYYEGSGEEAVPVKKTRFKLYDKLSALNSVAKHLGMFTDDVRVRGKIKHEHAHEVGLTPEAKAFMEEMLGGK